MHRMLARRTVFLPLLLLTAFWHRGQAAAQEVDSGQAAASADATAGVHRDELEALKAEGQEIYYRDCHECHTDGGMGPTLNGRTWLKDGGRVLKILVQGGGDMPEFRSTLTDREIAAVATYVRNAWDNRFGVVLESEARKAREAAETR
jgi:mono/diheme cytochrome c family protein